MSEDPDQDGPPADKLSDMMERAAAGSLLDALEVVKQLASIVSLSNTRRDWNDPSQRIVEPVPDFVREYLGRALEQIANGIDARDAFHLRKKRGGQHVWTHSEKASAVYILQQLVGQDLTVDEAAVMAAELINAFALRPKKDRPASASPWRKFAERPVDDAMLKTWYYQLRSKPK